MSYQKLQGYVAFETVISDDAMIPFPTEVVNGQATGTSTNELQDSNATFVTSGVKAGDIVFNTTDNTMSTVKMVAGENKLLLNANNMASGEKYIIYAGGDAGGAGKNNGCVLYIGTSGNIQVKTVAGQTVVFKNVPVGFFPVQVVQIYKANTTAGDFIALW